MLWQGKTMKTVGLNDLTDSYSTNAQAGRCRSRDRQARRERGTEPGGRGP